MTPEDLIKQMLGNGNESEKDKKDILSEMADEIRKDATDDSSLSNSLHKTMLNTFNEILTKATFNLLVSMLDDDRQDEIKLTLYNSWVNIIKTDMGNLDNGFMNQLFNTSEVELNAFKEADLKIKQYLGIPEDYE